MTLYETIFKRRSARRYSAEPLSEAVRADIEARANSEKRLFDREATFELVGGGDLKGGMAPYALTAYSDGDDASKVNIGYVLQDLDLYIQSIGLGSVWCGMARPRERKSDYRILLGFGNTDVPFRAGEDAFKRKNLSDISQEDNAVARAVRVAPSAVNLQPWKLKFYDGKVVIESAARGVGKLLPGKIYLYDLGIAVKHAELALRHEGRAVTGIKIIDGTKPLAVEIDYE
ncbi:MAG: hypothetical protein LBP26_04560 [Clostridiales bacterium]|jgi:nitroreductase|nr:hypothetical protein [Clostridiales bacterium]